jgi:2-amino-4-hydroxy-6-hydroxymethyldihydropteridine diphosphokinase
VRKKFFSPNFEGMSDHVAYILVGSNLGDRFGCLQKAAEYIVRDGNILLAASSVYETEPWGSVEQPAFLNQALKIRTVHTPQKLMHNLLSLLSIESEMGRIRNGRMDARIIDIDILFYDDIILNAESVTIPHPRIHERKFVLQPLYEIAPKLIHPSLHQSIETLLEVCKDPLDVFVRNPRTDIQKIEKS